MPLHLWKNNFFTLSICWTKFYLLIILVWIYRHIGFSKIPMAWQCQYPSPTSMLVSKLQRYYFLILTSLQYLTYNKIGNLTSFQYLTSLLFSHQIVGELSSIISHQKTVLFLCYGIMHQKRRCAGLKLIAWSLPHNHLYSHLYSALLCINGGSIPS